MFLTHKRWRHSPAIAIHQKPTQISYDAMELSEAKQLSKVIPDRQAAQAWPFSHKPDGTRYPEKPCKPAQEGPATA